MHTQTHLQSMAAVNWFCLVLAFVLIKTHVCIKVDPNEIPNGNYTTSSLKSYTLQPYGISTIISNETNNFTLLGGDTELSASERTRRLIPYMAFYVPVSELPINKQYINRNNIHPTKQLVRPTSATGGGGGGGTGPTGSHIPIPTQYVHGDIQYLPPAPSAPSSIDGQQLYHPNAGLSIYHTHGYGGQQEQLQPKQHQQHQQQFHLVPPSKEHLQHLQPPGPPGPSALALPSFDGHGKGNGKGNNAFVTYKEVNPIRQKTVQYFPPLTSTASSASTSSASVPAFETIRQTSSFTKQQQKVHHQHGVGGSSGNNNNNAADAVYRSRTKQSKINLTPFTPSNTVPGDFVPIVYKPINNNNNNNNYNNHIFNSHKTVGEEINNDSSFNQDEQKQQQQQQYRKQQHQQQPQSQQIAIEYSSSASLLPSSGSVAPIPLDVSQRHHHHHYNQQQLQKLQQQSQYYSVTQPGINAVDGGAGVGTITSADSVNSAYHQHHNDEAISPPTIFHQNQHHHQKQQQQQLQPDKFFESEIQVQQRQHQHQHPQQQQKQHYIEQVLKDVKTYSIKNSQMLTPQEKYVMYLQQRLHYNKNQQRHQATRHEYREHNNNNNNNSDKTPQQHQYVKQYQQNPLQGTLTAVAPIRTTQPPLQYDLNYPQHDAINHDLYPKTSFKPTLVRGGGTNSEETEEQILTIPVHRLFGQMDTLQQQQQHYHYPQSHFASSSSLSSPSSKYKSHYSKNGSSKLQYNEYLIDEPKQSLDDEQQQQQQQNQLELLKPTVGPPTHALILVTTAAPFQQERIPQENYGTSLRPSYNSKPKIRLQPVVKEKNVVNYAAIREQNPTERPRIISITPTPESHQYNAVDEKPKYVYVKEEFGQKLSTVTEGGTVKLKPLNKYKSDDSQIPQQHQHHHHQQQHIDELSLQPLAPKLPLTTQHHHEYHHHNNNEVQANVPFTPPKTILADPNELPDIRTSSLAEILHKLQESNHLPHTLTPDNIDNSIKTLIRILNNLKQTQTIVANPPQHHEVSAHAHPSSPDYDYTTGSEEHHQQPQPHDLSLLTPTGPNKHPGPSTGRPGIDYPNYAEIPQTSFECSQQRYKGFFGDPETNCQVWHYCDLNGGKASFLCPNGTIFSQIVLTCDWWFNVKCATTPQLYVLNERLYKYILPFTPKFPEDYSGPLVDKYLAMKFQEMEEKMRLDKEKALQEEAEEATTETEEQTIETVSENSKEENHLDETTTTTENEDNRPHVKQHKHESVNSQVSEQSSERNLLIDDEVNDIAERGTVDNFESTTIATGIATKNSELISFSLKPIIVSSTIGPDYDDENLESHEFEKRSNKNTTDVKETNKTKVKETKPKDDNDKSNGVSTENTIPPASTTMSPNKMQITVEKLDVIEIKPDGATGHLIRDMLSNSKKTN